jgi:transaldolase
MNQISDLAIEIFADGADLKEMLELSNLQYISGLTTNPTLMRMAGITNYAEFAKEVLAGITEKPISFEVFSDDLDEMVTQGEKIASWGENVFVKIPITNTKGVSTAPAIKKLSNSGVKINVTAVMTVKQVYSVLESLNPNVNSNISVFAGRIADTGIDPLPIVRDCLEITSQMKSIKLIWASPRELLNIFQADSVGCHIITATKEILNKIPKIGYDLDSYSLDTVNMFYRDAAASNFAIE